MHESNDDRVLPNHIASTGQAPYHQPKFIVYGGLTELIQNGIRIGTDRGGDDNTTGS